MGILIKWDITYKCNLFCEHCINGEFLDRNSDDLSIYEVQNVVNNINNVIPINNIHFLGGEPLVRTDFLDILSFLDTKKIRFGFNTNGLLLNNTAIDCIGRMNSFSKIVLSLEGPDANTNDVIRGKNIFNIVCNRLENLRSYKDSNGAKFLICVNMVVMKNNYRYINKMVELCNKLGIDELSLLDFIPEGNAQGSNLQLDGQELLSVMKDVAEAFSRENKVRIIPKFARPVAVDYINKKFGLDFPDCEHACGAGANSIFLDNKGYAYTCDRDRNMGGQGYDCKNKPFGDIWETQNFKNAFGRYCSRDTFNNLTPCNSCKYLFYKCYPCHLSIHNKNSRYQIDQCVLLNKELSKEETV